MKRRFALALFFIVIGLTGYVNGQEPVGTTTGGPLLSDGLPVYGINDGSELNWYLHRGYLQGTFTWVGPVKVGTGWDGLLVFKGDPRGRDGVIYRVDSRGDLYWYKHRGHLTGSTNWDGGKKVGSSWQGNYKVFSGGPGIVYRIDNAGDLYWYRHYGYQDGTPNWSEPKKVGNGWKAGRLVFSGGEGVIYFADPKGDLYWYKHLGFQDGTARWEARKLVGNGWNIVASAFSGGEGLIYTLRRDGHLYWYNHLGFRDGAASWEGGGIGKKIGDSWAGLARIF